MSRVTKVVGILFSLVLLVFCAGFVLPSQVHVEREITINAAPEEIFALVSDFHAWETWSPWAKLDPNAEMDISGLGLGQTMAWSSDNPQVGEGTQEITAIEAPHLLKTHLEFAGQGLADATFMLTPKNETTAVTWSLDTNMREGVSLLMQPINTYLGFMMDSMVGRDYETGLNNLKLEAET